MTAPLASLLLVLLHATLVVSAALAARQCVPGGSGGRPGHGWPGRGDLPARRYGNGHLAIAGRLAGDRRHAPTQPLADAANDVRSVADRAASAALPEAKRRTAGRGCSPGWGA